MPISPIRRTRLGLLNHAIIHMNSIKIDYNGIDSYKVNKNQEQNINVEIPLS